MGRNARAFSRTNAAERIADSMESLAAAGSGAGAADSGEGA